MDKQILFENADGVIVLDEKGQLHAISNDGYREAPKMLPNGHLKWVNSLKVPGSLCVAIGELLRSNPNTYNKNNHTLAESKTATVVIRTYDYTAGSLGGKPVETVERDDLPVESLQKAINAILAGIPHAERIELELTLNGD